MTPVRRALPVLHAVSYFAFAAFWWVLIFDESSRWVLILGVIGLPGAIADLVVENRRRWLRWRARRSERLAS